MNKHVRNSLYLFSLLPGLICVWGNSKGFWYAGANLFFSLGFLAIVEWLTPPLSSNESSTKEDLFPKLVLLLHLPVQLLSVGSLLLGVQNGTLPCVWAFLAAISTGINTGSSAIVVSHEFIHQKNKLEQFFGRWLLFTAGNMYFFIDHLRVHHKWVGTEKDHATARKGESLYFFFLRSAMGQWGGAIKIENERLKKKGERNWGLNHYVYRQFILHAMFDTLLVWWGGFFLLAVFVFHCVVANFLLEYVNYVQHYGLSRGEKEKVTEMHSWDSDLFVSRFVLVDLSRHSDHHEHASKRYHTLVNTEKSPKMPSGYAGLFFVAAIPPLWFSLMNPRIPA